MMRTILAAAALALTLPAAAQDHSGHGADPHVGHAMGAQKAPADDPHAGHDMATMDPAEEEVGNAPAPAPPSDHAADAIYGAERMAPARRQLVRENGYFRGSMILLDMAEYQLRQGEDGYAFEGEAWFGGDINKVMIKAEGEGNFGEAIEHAEVQLLYARAVGPYWNAHAGIRHDIVPNPSRTHAVVGIEGVAPYWFHLKGQLFLSNKGELSARAEGSYDQRITQRLILVPRFELNLAAEDAPQLGIGSGLSDIELGLRLRYEISKKFAPYVGVEWARKLGDTASYARLAGEDPDVTNFVAGIRFWF